MRFGASLLLLTLAISFGPAVAETANIAAAANFAAPARAISEAFDGKTRLSIGVTGQLFLKIRQGAPYDILLAADQARPALAIAEGLGVKGSSFTYALGRLALFSRDSNHVAGLESLRDQSLRKIAIANPATAPYGAAAIDVLQALTVFGALESKIVQGKNVTQAYQFAAVGAADLAIVAASLTVGETKRGYTLLIPADMHRPIAQDAVLLTRGQGNATAKAYLAFLKSPEALAIMRRYKYYAPMNAVNAPNDRD